MVLNKTPALPHGPYDWLILP
uniref:Uncharacterized protein n=1 Tax=Anguilla anguilla TaxID=7936 RepID=A0A0E9VZ14_ANGAN